MDTPAPAKAPEPGNTLPVKAGWMTGSDMEYSLVAGAFLLLAFMPQATSDPVLDFFRFLGILGSYLSLGLFSLSGTRHEKGRRRLVCAILLAGWMVVSLVVIALLGAQFIFGPFRLF